MNQHQFFTGEIFDAYRWFGAHIEQNAVVFRTFAPNASRITLTGACNGWTETDLVQDGRSGFWSVSVPDARAGQFYKYRIYGTAIPTALQWNCGLPAARSSPTSRSTASQTKRG